MSDWGKDATTKNAYQFPVNVRFFYNFQIFSLKIMKWRGIHEIGDWNWITKCKAPFTSPRPSEISEKNWSTWGNLFLTSHLWYKAILKVWKDPGSPLWSTNFTNYGWIGCAIVKVVFWLASLLILWMLAPPGFIFVEKTVL